MATTEPGNTYTASNFYNSELNRLNEKQQNSDLITNSNERLAILNNSYRKRYAKYVEMLMVLVLSYILYLGIVIFQKNVPSVPIFIVDAITVILFFSVFIYLFSAFWELSIRSLLNYDELDLPPYDASGVDVSALINNGQLFSKQGNANPVCVGNECCPTSYTYDKNANVCVPSPTAAAGSDGAAGYAGVANAANAADATNAANAADAANAAAGYAGATNAAAGYAGATNAANAADAANAANAADAANAAAGYAGATNAANAADAANAAAGYAGLGLSGISNLFNRSGFTTLEYSNVENAYTDMNFNSPQLKRSPNYQNVIPVKDATKLNVSKF